MSRSGGRAQAGEAKLCLERVHEPLRPDDSGPRSFLAFRSRRRRPNLESRNPHLALGVLTQTRRTRQRGPPPPAGHFPTRTVSLLYGRLFLRCAQLARADAQS